MTFKHRFSSKSLEVTASKKNLVVFIIIFVAALISEIYVNISSLELSLFSMSNIEVLITISITLLGILVASYHLIYQVFRNRYPFEFLQEKIKIQVDYTSKHYILNILIGIGLIVLNVDVNFLAIVYLIHTIFCVTLLLGYLNKYKLFDQKHIMDNYKKEIVQKIENGDLNINEINSILSQLTEYSEDSFIRGEIGASKYILHILGELNKVFIEERAKLITKYELSEEEIVKTEEKLYLSLLKLSNISINYGNKNFSELCFNELDEILMLSVKCDNLDAFSRLVNITNQFVIFNLSRENYAPFISMINIYENIFEYLINNNQRDEWIEKCSENFELYNFTTSIYSSEVCARTLLDSYFYVLGILVDNNNTHQYSNIIKQTFTFINRLLKDNINSSLFNFVKVNFLKHNNSLIDKKNNNILNQYVSNLIECTDRNIYFGYQEFYSVSALTLRILMENYPDNEVKKKLTEDEFNIISSYLDKGTNLNILHIPEYEKSIEEMYYNLEFLEEINNKYLELFRKVLLKDHTDLFNHLLYKFNLILYKLDKQKRSQQESVINVYSRLFNMVITLKQNDKFHITLNKYIEVFTDLDKEAQISTGITNQMLDVLYKILNRCIDENHNNFTNSIVYELEQLLNLKIILSKKELQEKIISILFKSGMYAIENNNEDVIKVISNKLGWIAKNSIEQGRGETLNYTLSRAVKLFNASVDMEINDKVKIFIGTLFIVLGGYAHSLKTQTYLATLLNAVRGLRNRELLKKSKMLRIYESEKWDKIIGGNAIHHIGKFHQMIEGQNYKKIKHTKVKNEKQSVKRN